MSCENQGINKSTLDNPNNSLLASSRNNDECSLKHLSSSNFEEGKFHNFLVDLWIKELDFCPIDPNKVSDFLISVIIDNLDIILERWSFNDRNELLLALNEANLDIVTFNSMTYNDYWRENLENLGFPDNLTNVVSNYDNLLYQQSNDISYSEVYDLTCAFYEENLSNLNNETEQYLFELFIDVAINSAEFWMNEENGGQNGVVDGRKINKLCQGEQDYSNNNRFAWVLHDATGALAGALAAGATTGGAAFVPNPLLGGIPTAGVVGAITGAAASINSLWP